MESAIDTAAFCENASWSDSHSTHTKVEIIMLIFMIDPDKESVR